MDKDKTIKLIEYEELILEIIESTKENLYTQNELETVISKLVESIYNHD